MSFPLNLPNSMVMASRPPVSISATPRTARPFLRDPVESDRQPLGYVHRVRCGPNAPALLDSCAFPRGGLPAHHCRAPRIGPMLRVRGSTRIRALGRAARLLAAASPRSGAEVQILATSATRRLACAVLPTHWGRPRERD